MKRVLMIGLPYFTINVKSNLFKFDTNHQYIVLNTYYKIWDKIRYLFLLPFCQTVYSINGTIDYSFALSLAIKLKKKVVMHWVGSDIIAAQKAYAENKYKKAFIEKAIHLTDTPWFVAELSKIGIKAKFQSLILFEKMEPFKPFPSVFSALIYIPQNNQEFYGIYKLKNIVKQLPSIQFDVIGTEKPIIDMPSNVIFHGWVNNTKSYIQNSYVCMRFPEHDGLSFFVLEALSQQRYVIYNQKLDYTLLAQNENEVVDRLKQLKDSFDSGNLKPNLEAARWVEHHFSSENFIKLIDYLTV
ncbi:MAG: hypothetical protein HPY79_06625 [Bacteroidales bacterium]|nr:hypothetical protein [Bacteroidales bacterium]